MLKYFSKNLRLSIFIELQNKELKLKSFIQIVKRAVVAKAKKNLQPRAITWNTNQHHPWDFRLTYTTATKANTQDQSIKYIPVEDFKAQSLDLLTTFL